MVSNVIVEQNRAYIGQDIALVQPVVDKATGLPQSMTTWTLAWTLRQLPRSGGAQLLLVVDPDITLLTTEAGVLAGVSDDAARVFISRELTYAEVTGDILVPAGQYLHGLWRIDVGAWVPITEGTFWLTFGAGGQPLP